MVLPQLLLVYIVFLSKLKKSTLEHLRTSAALLLSFFTAIEFSKVITNISYKGNRHINIKQFLYLNPLLKGFRGKYNITY